MDRERFEQIVAAYGAEPRRWPADERAAAEAFATAHADAATLLAEARATDALLEAAQDAAAPSDLLAARILKRAPVAAAPITWRPFAALVACAVLGLALGFGGALMAPRASSADAALNAAFGDSWSDHAESGSEG